MKDALSYQVQQLLKQNSITVDSTELAFQIKSHPTYPSLHAVTGVLDHFNIENLALDVPTNIDTLNQLPNTFLAQIKIDTQKQFAIVTKLKNSYQLLINSKNKKTLTQSEFLEQFTGIVLVVDKEESKVLATTSDKAYNLYKGLLITSAILFGVLLLNVNSEIVNYVFISLCVTGIYITSIIFKQEQGESTVLGNAFCSNPSKKKNCNAVLSSKGATIYRSLKLSDLSLIYFVGLTIASLILILSNSSLFAPKLLSIIALPITIYSIYYQYAVVKKWCALCLSIVGLMWIQAGFSLATLLPNYQLTPALITAASFTTIAAFWLIVSKFYKDNKSLNNIKLEYFKFKRNFELFNNQLSKSKTIDTQIENTKEIVFGNTNSNFNITLISNPLCGHCRSVHDLANQIIKQFSDSINLRIRFNVNPKITENTAVKITSRLLEIYHTEGREKSLEAMDEIYGEVSYQEWLKKWKESSTPEAYESILQNEYSWCSDNNINFTPEILINGQAYPKVYDRKDLIYFIEDLVEQFETNSHKIPLHSIQKV